MFNVWLVRVYHATVSPTFASPSRRRYAVFRGGRLVHPEPLPGPRLVVPHDLAVVLRDTYGVADEKSLDVILSPVPKAAPTYPSPQDMGAQEGLALMGSR